MRIDAGSSKLYASQRPQASTADHSTSTSFSAALATTKPDSSKSDGIKSLDFSSMTRQEMRDWANTKFSSGELSFDDTRPFMLMGMKVAVGGGEIPVEGDGVRYDFMQHARNAMLAARLQKNEVSAGIFELGLSIMQREQGHAIGISSRA